jgi:hypothetical protein
MTKKQTSAARKTLAKSLVANARSAMFAAVEIHNKPVFQFRYEVCTSLVINAWELALKAYIAQEITSVRLIMADGTTKPFTACVACVSSKIGKPFEAVKYNLEVLYDYRNKVVHFYQEDLGIVVLGLLKSSVLFFSEFMEEHFNVRLYEEANLILLPIGFSRPVSPLDFLSNQSATKDCSAEVKSFLASIKKSAVALQEQGIDDSIIINYTIGLVNESRIKNADLTAAINNALPQGNVIAVYNVISAANLTNDPSAKLLRLSEESIFGELFTESYFDVVSAAKQRFSDFSQNFEFHEIMRELKKNPNLARMRLLNPKKPAGSQQTFYSKNIVDELEKHYTARRPT